MKIQIHRTITPNLAPANGSLLEGELAVEIATDPPRLWVGVPTNVDPTGKRILVQGSSVNPAEYLRLSGGSMTGPLELFGDPTQPLGAVTKQYVDARMSSGGGSAYLPLTGGTMNGPLYLARTPIQPMEAATKDYIDYMFSNVDVASYLPLAGGSMTGPIYLPANPTQPSEASNKQYVDGLISTAGNGRFLPIGGGSLTGFLNLHATPTAPFHAATREYVDSVAGSGNFLPLVGGSLSGPLSIYSSGVGYYTLNVATEPANNAGILITGATRPWLISIQGTANPNPAAFVLWDIATGTQRLRIDPGTGTVIFDAVGTLVAPNANIPGTITGGAVNSSGNMAAAGSVSAGYIWCGGSIDASNAVNATNSIWTGGTITGGTIAASFNITANQAISAASTITAGGAITGLTVYATTTLGAGSFINAAYYTIAGVKFIDRDANATNFWDAGGAWRFSLMHNTSYTYNQANVHAWNNQVGTIITHMHATEFYLYNQAALKPGGGPFTATSDLRTKRNVAEYTSGLAEVLQLAPITYQYNGLGGTPSDDRTYVGLLADDVELVMPEMVGSTMQPMYQPSPITDPLDLPDKEPDNLLEFKTLDTNALQYAVINALKEVDARLRALEAATPIRTTRDR